MSQEQRSVDSGPPVERIVQMTGNSTFTVSLPKEWSLENGLDSGTSMYLYPHDDRLVAAPKRIPQQDRTITIDADETPIGRIFQQIRAAYITGYDPIIILSEGGDSELRRKVEREVGHLIGVTIQETTDELQVTDLLDASQISLAQMIAQMQQLTLEMYDDALEALLTGNNELARQVIERDDEVDRLFAFVCRGFYLGLEDIHQLSQLDINRTEAFSIYQTARSLERIADHSEGISEVAIRQPEPPTQFVSQRLESIGDSARTGLKAALASEPKQAHEITQTLREEISRLDQQLYEGDEQNAYLYGRVVERLRRIAENGNNIAETVTESAVEDACNE